MPATTEWFAWQKGQNGQPNRFHSWCRRCLHAASKKWQEENSDRYKAYQKQYYAANRERIIVRSAEWLKQHPEKRAIWAEAHRGELRERARIWAKEHPEKALAKHRNRQARKLGNGGSHTADDVRAQYERQKGQCFYCGEAVGTNYHVDHVIPLVLGGSNGPENLVIACPECNQQKHAKHPMEFCGRLF